MTTLTRGGSGTAGYSLDVSGTLDATYYTLSHLKGPTNGYGLELLSGATITNLANGTFNNYQSVTASDAYIWVHDGLIGTGNPTKSFANVTFTQNGAGAPEYSVSQTVTGPAGFWNFPTATCTGWTDCESSDNDTGSGNGTIQFGSGIRIPRHSASGQYPAIY